MRTSEVVPILFCTFNRVEFTKEALKALIKNTNRPFKLFIYDCGSTDITRDYLRIVKLNVEAEIFFSKGRISCDMANNDFFTRTLNYKYLAKVDNDSILPPKWLSSHIKFLKKNNLNAVTAMHYSFSRKAVEIMEAHAKGDFTESLAGGSGILYRGDLYDKLGPIQIKVGWMDNIEEWWVRVHHLPNDKCLFNPDIFMELLDMEGHYKRRVVYPEYDKEIEDLRYRIGRTFGNISEVVKDEVVIRDGHEIKVEG